MQWNVISKGRCEWNCCIIFIVIALDIVSFLSFSIMFEVNEINLTK